MPTRNAVFAALFALTANLQLDPETPALVKRSRKFRHFSKVATDQQPALFQTEHTETATERTNQPAVRKWQANWTLMTWADPDDESQLGTVWLNDYLDAFDKALKPPPGQPKQTLGGLVHHAFAEGTILKVPGDDDGQGLLTYPIILLVP